MKYWLIYDLYFCLAFQNEMLELMILQSQQTCCVESHN